MKGRRKEGGKVGKKGGGEGKRGEGWGTRRGKQEK